MINKDLGLNALKKPHTAIGESKGAITAFAPSIFFARARPVVVSVDSTTFSSL